jgi:putative flippase GtrA
MFTFLKAQASSLIATVVDFLVTILLKEVLGVWYLAASITGTICGGAANFLLGRNWAFSSTEDKVEGQALRYIMVWLGNLALNAGGVYFFTGVIKLELWISKVMVSLIVGIGYNYVLQKIFVFKKQG